MKKLRKQINHPSFRTIVTGSVNLITAALLLSACQSVRPADGLAVETQVLSDNHLSRDYSDSAILDSIIRNINCADSTLLKKIIVQAGQFHSWDTSEILLIPYISNGKTFKSAAYSDIVNRFILVNPSYIHGFTLKNTLNDTSSYSPVLELMLLHEIGHFILRKPGAFDRVESLTGGNTGQAEHDNTQPEFLTTIKKVELDADSLAIDLVKRELKSPDYKCLNIAFDVERIVPGMQFQLSGMRMIENFGSHSIGFLHDPSNDHPNMELRITFMNYFLYPSDSLRQMIDDYLYNRTVAPVHNQESDPRIYQGQEKKLPGDE